MLERLNLALDSETLKNIRKIQSQMIIKDVRNVSISQVINQLLKDSASIVFGAKENPIILVDTYYLDHPRMKVNKDWEVCHMYNRTQPQILYGIEKVVQDIISQPITPAHVQEAKNMASRMNLKFPEDLFTRVIEETNGYMPLRIESFGEGKWCPAKSPFIQIKNTVKGFGSLVPWFEVVLMHCYFETACLTRAYQMRKYLEENKMSLNRFHSFGSRGHRSVEDMYKASSAWVLAGMKGTDDFLVSKYITNRKFGSISALAHTVVQNFGIEHEYEAYQHAVTKSFEDGFKIVALVIDTYSTQAFIDRYLFKIAKEAQTMDMTIVCRPDSGDVFEFAKRVYQVVSDKKLKNVKCIIGEDMSFEKCIEYDKRCIENNIPLDFMTYGIGGKFYSDITRETLGWAMKTASVNNKPVMKFSDTPIKESIPGEVEVINVNNRLIVYPRPQERKGIYELVYHYSPDMETPYVRKTPLNTMISRIEDIKNIQEQIDLSDEIIQLKEEIKIKYHNSFKEQSI